MATTASAQASVTETLETDRPHPSPPVADGAPSKESTRVRERRLSSTPSASAVDVGAPSVWATPDWAVHPVVENYYGHTRRGRVSSFYEVMQSPTNTFATRTLAENCLSYDTHSDSDVDARVGDDNAAHSALGLGGRKLSAAAVVAQPTRKLGSFSYSYTTETSEDVASASPFSTSTADCGYETRRVHTVAPAIRRASSERATRHTVKSTAMGYAHWNRQRLQQDATTDLVPIPQPNSLRKLPPLDTGHNRGNVDDENPQAGHESALDPSPSASTTSSVQIPESPPPGKKSTLTSGKLKSKLQDSLLQIDDRIDVEIAMVRDAYHSIERSAKASAKSKRESVMWSLLCGVRGPGSGSSGSTPFVDGLDSLHDRLAVAMHHRALNQLQRHRRHVNGIFQIVTSHNPDLYLTEKQLDSFETADAMLDNDVKFWMLHKQVHTLRTTITKRRGAFRHATVRNGRECFQSTRTKSAMLAKLLEAVSWYRLVQTNARDESASTSVGLSVAAAQPHSQAQPQPSSTHDLQDTTLSSSDSSGSSSSITSGSRSLQEIQVERILSVLAGEEFYSDYNELMCQPDWWEIAQAHFENIVFASADVRVCQWVLRVSRDVAAVCYEPLEDEYDGLRGAKAQTQFAATAQTPAEWTSDPQPDQILEFVDRLTRRIRKDLSVPTDVTKSLHVFIQRMVFPRLALLCFNQKTVIDCQRKDKLWRKRCVDLAGLPLENLLVRQRDLVAKIKTTLPSRRVAGGRNAYFVRAIDAFNSMNSVVPCDLLDELMHGVVILHHEAALVLGTTQFSVETFFPLLSYVLLHCRLPTIHAQLHLLENFAITTANANGEESYYVYCVHAAVEYICNSAGLSTDVVKEE